VCVGTAAGVDQNPWNPHTYCAVLVTYKLGGWTQPSLGSVKTAVEQQQHRSSIELRQEQQQQQQQ